MCVSVTRSHNLYAKAICLTSWYFSSVSPHCCLLYVLSKPWALFRARTWCYYNTGLNSPLSQISLKLVLHARIVLSLKLSSHCNRFKFRVPCLGTASRPCFDVAMLPSDRGKRERKWLKGERERERIKWSRVIFSREVQESKPETEQREREQRQTQKEERRERQRQR